MNNIALYEELYKPYKITKKNNVTIIKSTSGSFVIKKKSKDLNKLNNYLKSRNFNHIASLVDDKRNEDNVFSYLEEIEVPLESKAHDGISLLASLHNKTTFYKNVSFSKYETLYNNLNNNILYYENYYKKLFDEYILEEFNSPFEIIYLNNYTKLVSLIAFLKSTLNDWFLIVSKKDTQRVTVVHNNMKLSHVLESVDGPYLISFDNYIYDTPIIDLVSFYKDIYDKVDFRELLKEYLDKYTLNKDELYLFIIMVSMPQEFSFKDSNLNDCIMISKYFNYIDTTSELIRPYYTIEQKEENNNFDE